MRTLIFFFIAFSGLVAHADETQLSESQLEMLADKEPKKYLPKLLQRLDADMNESLEKQLAASTNKVKEALLAAQKAWLVFRDADSLFELAGDDGGSGASVFAMERRIYQTRLRIYQLDTSFEQGWQAVPKNAPEKNAAEDQQPPTQGR